MMANTVFGDPSKYKVDLEAYLKLTPAEVMAVARKWLERPNYRTMLKPGPRMTPPGDESGAGPEAADAPKAAVVAPAAGTRGPIPAVGAPDAARIPKIEQARLNNGIPILYVQSDTIPFTRIALNFDFGTVDDPAGKRGAINWMFSMLDEGAAGHDDHWFKQYFEETGSRIGAFSMPTEAAMSINAPSASLVPTLNVAMMMLTHPDFPQDRLEQLRRMRMSFVTGAPENPRGAARPGLRPGRGAGHAAGQGSAGSHRSRGQCADARRSGSGLQALGPPRRSEDDRRLQRAAGDAVAQTQRHLGELDRGGTRSGS
jgi:hypothetical protein